MLSELFTFWRKNYIGVNPKTKCFIFGAEGIASIPSDVPCPLFFLLLIKDFLEMRLSNSTLLLLGNVYLPFYG
jgi:hypothetical protein